MILFKFNLIRLVFGVIVFSLNLRAQSPSSDLNEKVISDMTSKIKTEVDSNFVYKFKQTKFVPPKGKTLLIMGQTTERVIEYNEVFLNSKPPAGWSAYWGVTEFRGIEETHKNETGSSQNHQMIVDQFPNAVIHSAMWMVGKWDIVNKVYDGQYDDVLKKYAKWLKSVNRPIYLRIGYKFDGIHNELNPYDYLKAYT